MYFKQRIFANYIELFSNEEIYLNQTLSHYCCLHSVNINTNELLEIRMVSHE